MSKVSQIEYNRIAEQLEKYGQRHVLRHWETLNESSRQRLASQICQVDLALVQRLTRQYIGPAVAAFFRGECEPAPVITLSHQRQHPDETKQLYALGEKILRTGTVAALLVAGGQGSRLGFEGPKGVFAIGPVTNRSLFQLHAEKLLACDRRYRVVIPWYIMTSETNDAETRDFFEQHDYFGLQKNDVFFFQQGQMPALDANGKLILDAPDHLFMSPDGHGGTLKALQKSGALADLARRGIEEIFYFQVDNVLINMCDPLFIGYHAAAQAEMSAKVCSKRHAHEKMGVVGKMNGRMCVIEYSDLSAAEKEARLADGRLKHNFGSLAIHLFKRRFIEREAGNSFSAGGQLPWHVAHKKIPYLDETGKLVNGSQPNGYKFETFIFDALGDAREVVFMEVDRRDEFSCVKNAEGEDSPMTAQTDLMEVYARWLQAAGVRVPRDASGRLTSRIQISPLFALDASELAQKISPTLKIEETLNLK